MYVWTNIEINKWRWKRKQIPQNGFWILSPVDFSSVFFPATFICRIFNVVVTFVTKTLKLHLVAFNHVFFCCHIKTFSFECVDFINALARKNESEITIFLSRSHRNHVGIGRAHWNSKCKLQESICYCLILLIVYNDISN